MHYAFWWSVFLADGFCKLFWQKFFGRFLVVGSFTNFCLPFLLEQEVVPKRIVEMEEAIKNRDFPSFSRLACADSNQFHAVCLDTLPPIFYMNDTSHRQALSAFSPSWTLRWHITLFCFFSSIIFIFNLDEGICFRIISCVEKWNRSEESPQVCFCLLTVHHSLWI